MMMMMVGSPDEQGYVKKRLGIDFGMNSTVIAEFNGEGGAVSTLEFPGWSRRFPLEEENTTVAITPSLIHYTDTGSVLVGEQVNLEKHFDNPATARWMKQYISQNSPAQFIAGKDQVTGFRQAATDFLMALLSSPLLVNNKPEICESVFTFPVESPQCYISWLEDVAILAGFGTNFLIDEAHAAVLGYGLNPRLGCKVLIIEFGQDGLDVRIVAIDEEIPHPSVPRSRILGRAVNSMGGLAIDRCIFQAMLSKDLPRESDATIRRIQPEILHAISRMREKLSLTEDVPVQVTDPLSGRDLTGYIRCADLERIFNEQGILSVLNRTLERALAAARMRGCDEDQITAVLMMGECSTLPPVRKAVKQRFFNHQVLYDHVVDAVARGAAHYSPFVSQPDRIRKDYALRYWDPTSNEHRYRFLVRNGARYPSAGQVARIIISASYDSQSRMGIPIYEICDGGGDANLCNIELISDSGGGMRIAGPAPDAETGRKLVWVNEHTPAVLVASPPAQKGEPRFELTFTIDMRRNLCVTARDIITGMLIKNGEPLFRMN
jgi:molecular chaperone DnaK (HSP70)